MSDSLSRTLKKIKPLDRRAMEASRARQSELTKPEGSLGRLEELSIQVAGIEGQIIAGFKHKAIITMAADHGVVKEGVTLYPQEVTAQMVANFLNGGAGINVLASFIGARVVVVDMGTASDIPPNSGLICRKIARGTKNMAEQAAMTSSQAVEAIEEGIKIVEDEISRGLDIVGTGDMGIGNTTASSAMCAAITGESVKKVTGRGEGLGNEQLDYKIKIIEKALEFNKPDSRNAIDVLAKVGGFEIGGLAGVMLGAAAHHIPVVVDGFISGAAALIAAELSPELKHYLIAAHLSAERGHKILLQYLGLTPLLKLDMRLGEGTGAALGMVIVEAAVKTLAEMATFNEAGVSQSPSS